MKYYEQLTHPNQFYIYRTLKVEKNTYFANFDIKQIKNAIMSGQRGTAAGPSGIGNDFIYLLAEDSNFI